MTAGFYLKTVTISGRLVRRVPVQEPQGAHTIMWLLTDADQVPGEEARPGNGKAAVLAAVVGPVGSQL